MRYNPKILKCNGCGLILRDCDVEHIRTQKGRTNCPNHLAQEELWEDVCPECDTAGDFEPASEQETIDYLCDTDGGAEMDYKCDTQGEDR